MVWIVVSNAVGCSVCWGVESGHVYTWGDGRSYQLGYGRISYELIPTQVHFSSPSQHSNTTTNLDVENEDQQVEEENVVVVQIGVGNAHVVVRTGM